MRDHFVHIRNLPTRLLASLPQLIVNRQGKDQDAFMITRDIVTTIQPQIRYQFTFPELHAPTLNPSTEPISMATEGGAMKRPKHAILQGSWLDAVPNTACDANILGGMGTLVLDLKEAVSIPVIQANAEDLAFYQAQLLTEGSVFYFETEECLPLTEVSIGKDYVEQYLAHSEFGGGEYIEYHDQPHFWAPQHSQSGGHILLGRQIGADYYFTGFYIPFGSAIYLSPYTLHSDAYLVGDYVVVYALSSHFSTVLLRDQEKRMQRLQFVKEVV